MAGVKRVLGQMFEEASAAVRQLWRAPRFALTAATILALGIGANVAMFSVLRAVVLRPLPYPDSEHLVGLKSVHREKNIVQPALSLADFRDFRAEAKSYRTMAAYRPDFVGFARDGAAPVQLVCGKVTEAFFEVFAVAPQRGRTFREEEFSLGAPRTAMLSQAAWRRYFVEQADVVGQTVLFDDEPTTIVGVMPEGFREPEFVDLWLPFPSEAPENFVRDSRYWTTVGRLRDGVSLAEARAEAATIAAALAGDYPATNRGWSVRAQPLQEMVTGGLRGSLWLLCGAVSLVLAVACVNLANLMLARGVARSQELAVRLALGSTPRRLARAVLWECGLLAIVGGATGVVAVAVGLPVLVKLLPAGLLMRSHEIAVDGWALGFATLISVGTGLLFGLIPAWRVSRANVSEMLKAGSFRETSRRGAERWQGGLVAGQVALTLVVLVLAGLLMSSVLTLQRERPGFDPEGVVALRISPPPSRWENLRELADYYERVVTEVRREPGVELATLNCSAPMSGITLRYPFWVEGRPLEEGNADEAVFNAVDVDYFRTLRVPLRRGRWFDQRDDASAAETRPVCLINQSLAQRLFGADDPVGRRIRMLPWMVSGYREVIGVVGDVKQESLADEPTPQVYVPQQQSPWFFTTVLVRTRGANATMLQAAIRRADPTLTMAVETMEDALARSTLGPRVRAAAFAGFGGVALALSVLGIHANVTFLTAQRRREIGLRMALGATRAAMVRWVLGAAGRWVVVGGAAGLVLAFAAARLLRSLLPGVTASDAKVPLMLALFLAGVALAAALVPAWRAARLDPQRALQSE